MNRIRGLKGLKVLLAAMALTLGANAAHGLDLEEIKERGVLRHLSIPYANFDTGMGDGLDVEMMRMFADHLGVRYEYVRTDWPRVVAELTGQRVKPLGDEIEVLGEAEVKGDVAAHGFTVLPWREKALAFSTPTFPTQVWLISNAESPLTPIIPTGTLEGDIEATRKLIKGTTVMGKAGTCLDLSLYDIEAGGATGVDFEGGLNELAPALLAGESDLLLLDVPDALVALNKWPGKVKVLGLMSEQQDMAAGFRHSSPNLRAAFNSFLEQTRQDGTYTALVRKYYPDVFNHYPEFFKVKP